MLANRFSSIPLGTVRAVVASIALAIAMAMALPGSLLAAPGALVDPQGSAGKPVDLAAEFAAMAGGGLFPQLGPKAKPAAKPKSAPKTVSKPVVPTPFVHTQVVFMVDREVSFEMARVSGGTEVVITLNSPLGGVSQMYLSDDDPLVAGISMESGASGEQTRARVYLREHAVRSATQTLKRPFRVVLDLIHDLPTVPIPTPRVSAQGPPKDAYRSPFAISAPVDLTRPSLSLPVVVSGPISGDDSDFFSSAYTAYARGKMGRARDGFNTFLKHAPDSHLAESAAYLLVSMEYDQAWQQGISEQAKVAKRMDGLMRRYPRSPNLAISLLRMAEVLAGDAKWKQAKPLVLAVLDDYGDGPFARAAERLGGEIALGQNHVRTALGHFRTVRDGGTHDAHGIAATVGLAETMVRMGRYPEASRLYEEAIKLDPGHVKGNVHQLKLMGRALMEAGRFADARQVFLLLYNIFPDSYPAGVALSQVADTFRGEGLWELAERRYVEVIDRYPRSEGSLTARMSLADLYMDRQRTYGEVEMGPVTGGRLGRSSEDELLAESLKLYNQVVELAPSDALSEEAMYKIALLYQQMGDDETALSKARDLIIRNPNTHWKTPVRELGDELLADRATVLLLEGKAAEAVKLYRDYELALFTPNFRSWRPHYPLALASEAVGLNKQAMRHFLSLLGSRAPDEFRARSLYRLGSLYLRMDQPGEAIKRLKHHEKRFPNGANKVQVILRLAESHVVLGDDDLAAMEYRRYLKKVDGTKRREGRWALAKVYRRLGKPKQAVALHKAILKEDRAQDGEVTLSPASGQVALSMADLEFDHKAFGSATKAYDQALALGLDGDNRRWAELRRGQAQIALKRPTKGRQILATLGEESGKSLISNMAREVSASP